MNKQKGEKQAPAYFTGIINMLIEANSKGYDCNYTVRVCFGKILNSKLHRSVFKF